MDLSAKKYIACEDFMNGVSKEIVAAQYEEVKSAHGLIVALSAIEELFSLIANSYLEFEKSSVLIALDDLLGDGSAAQKSLIWQKLYYEQNLRILTLLTAARAYTEQVPQRLQIVSIVLPEIRKQSKEIFSTAFDTSFEYRIMDAFRNYAQHANLPIEGNTISSSNLFKDDLHSEDQPSRLRLTVDSYLSAKRLAENGSINAKTRSEIQSKGIDKLDTKYFVRSYVSELAKCHEALKKLTEDALNDALSKLEVLSNDLSASSNKIALSNVAIYDTDPKGRKSERTFVDFKFFSKILEKRKRWHALSYASRLFVSSELIEKRDCYNGENHRIWIPK